MGIHVIESTAARISAELAALGIDPDQPVKVTVETTLTGGEKLADLKRLIDERACGIAAGNVLDEETFFAKLDANFLAPQAP